MYFAGKDSFQNMQIQLTIKSGTGHYPCLHSFNLITINQHVTPLPLQQTRLERFPTNEAETRCDASPWQTTTSCEACTRWSHHARIERSTEQIKLILSPKKKHYTYWYTKKTGIDIEMYDINPGIRLTVSTKAGDSNLSGSSTCFFHQPAPQ